MASLFEKEAVAEICQCIRIMLWVVVDHVPDLPGEARRPSEEFPIDFGLMRFGSWPKVEIFFS